MALVKNLQEFLLNIKSSQWKELAVTRVRKVVIGNEACDLDSAICCIIYAYLLQSMDKQMASGAVLPILNIRRRDFPLRTEARYWLKKFSITEDILSFRDEIDLLGLAAEGDLHLYLVDHNILPSTDALLEPNVVSVLDHHQLERTDTPVYGMTVEPVGSCATLVTSEILSKNPTLLQEKAVASLLYGTILLDTINLSETAKRTTPKDVEMIEHLENVLNTDETGRSGVYEELISAKTDISELDSEQIFRKDLKVVSANNICIAVSSVPMLVRNYLSREKIDECMYNIAETLGYDVIVLVGIDVSGEVERDLAVISHRKTLRRELSSFLVSGQSGLLQLEPVENCRNRKCSTFYQRNSAASRKVILPLIKQWLETKMCVRLTSEVFRLGP